MFDKSIIEKLINWPAFGHKRKEKQNLLLDEMRRLSTLHLTHCSEYKRLVKSLLGENITIENLDDIFPLPVRLFKRQRLLSVPESDIVKTMTSSGTSGQQPSQIFLDKTTASFQVKVLSKIMADFIGTKRLPMLVIDCPATVKDRYRFSARTAGILGFSMFGRKVTYAFNDDMTINFEAINEFIEKYKNEKILLFGFTFIVWLHFVLVLEKNGERVMLGNGILIHGGGWKKLQSESVTKDEFKERLSAVTGISQIHNYYGMVEQTGSIFMECEYGHLHASAWSDILIRNPIDFKVLPFNKSGLIQLFSIIPQSYPGHSLLSEDIGRLLGEDDCQCGRKGRYFMIESRMENAEIRGCSDTYSQ